MWKLQLESETELPLVQAAAFDLIEISPFEHLPGEGIYKTHRNRT